MGKPQAVYARIYFASTYSRKASPRGKILLGCYGNLNKRNERGIGIDLGMFSRPFQSERNENGCQGGFAGHQGRFMVKNAPMDEIAAGRPRSSRKRTLITLLKLAFSVAVLIFVFAASKTSIRDILKVLVNVKVSWLALAFSLHAVGLLCSAYRWQIDHLLEPVVKITRSALAVPDESFRQFLHSFRFRITRTKGIDRDAEWSQLVGKGLGEAQYAGPGRVRENEIVDRSSASPI